MSDKSSVGGKVVAPAGMDFCLYLIGRDGASVVDHIGIARQKEGVLSKVVVGGRVIGLRDHKKT